LALTAAGTTTMTDRDFPAASIVIVFFPGVSGVPPEDPPDDDVVPDEELDVAPESTSPLLDPPDDEDALDVEPDDDPPAGPAVSSDEHAALASARPTNPTTPARGATWRIRRGYLGLPGGVP
jgi:hypothetical protein